MLWSTQNSNDFLLEKNLENYFDKPPINPYCFGYIIYIYIYFFFPCISIKGTFFGTTVNLYPWCSDLSTWEGQRFGRTSSCKTSATSIGCSSWTWVWNLNCLANIANSTQQHLLLDFKWSRISSISGDFFVFESIIPTQ